MIQTHHSDSLLKELNLLNSLKGNKFAGGTNFTPDCLQSAGIFRLKFE